MFVAWLIGWVALGLDVGRRIAKALKMEWAPAISAGVGTFTLFFVFVGFRNLIPCLGVVPYFLIGLWGLGVVLLTRFGTQDYSTNNKTAFEDSSVLLDENIPEVVEGIDEAQVIEDIDAGENPPTIDTSNSEEESPDSNT